MQRSRFVALLWILCLLALAACQRRVATPPAATATALFPTLTPPPFSDVLVATPEFAATPSPLLATATPPPTPRPPTSTPYLPPDIEIPAALESVPCETFEVRTRASSAEGFTLCGYVTVPESHADPANGRALRLAVVLYKSPARDAAPDPLLLAQGGPGGSTLFLFGNEMPFLLPPVLQSRDILLIEQRGARFSQPFLYCDEVEYYLLETLDDPAGYEDVYEKQDALQRCYDRLRRDGVNLNAYNSLENAHDHAYVAAALGYQQFNFYGVSYGALIGQHLAKLYPERVRSLVLDSVVPMETNWITEAPRSADGAFRALFHRCGIEPQCAALHPALEESFIEAIHRLNREPLDLIVQAEMRTLNIRLTGDLLLRVLYDMMYSEPMRVPAVIAAAAQGDARAIERRIADHAVYALAATNGMYASTMCAEDGDYSTDALVDIEGLYPDVARVIGGTLDNDLLELCPVWQVAPLPADVDAPAQSDTPALFLSGTLDPITPPYFADEVARGFPNSMVLTFRTNSHGVLFRSDCARRLMSAFILDPAAPLETGCVLMTE